MQTQIPLNSKDLCVHLKVRFILHTHIKKKLNAFMIHVLFFRGDVQNIKVMQYYELVFKLAKTMLEHYAG